MIKPLADGKDEKEYNFPLMLLSEKSFTSSPILYATIAEVLKLFSVKLKNKMEPRTNMRKCMIEFLL